MPSAQTAVSDRDSRHAATALGLSLSTDILLYLLLPMYADNFGVSLFQAGMLLAANRLVRIVGYGWVARLYERRGDRLICTVAVIAAAACSLGYATLSGFWMLLPLRLLWGMSYAALNLSTQALATENSVGAARRSGRSRAFIALGPAIALPLGALLAKSQGPRPIFFVLAAVALSAVIFTRRLPSRHHQLKAVARRFEWPNSLDVWSFLEGLTLDGLFIIGLSYLGKDLFAGSAVVIAGCLLAIRYVCEVALGPIGGRMAELFGAERLLVALSLLTCATLVGFGAGWLWSCAAFILVLRALQLPLVGPIVARRTPGPDRVRALATRSVWRDIGAGTGPVLAGFLLPRMPSLWIYAGGATLLALSALACGWETRPEIATS
jgi:MFS transporter, DHA1 family, inner membrane transport protein